METSGSQNGAHPSDSSMSLGFVSVGAASGTLTPADGGTLTWEASEYVHHDKGATWLILLGVIGIAGISVTLWFQQWMFAFLIAIMTVAFGYYAFRKPRVMHYELNDNGISIDGKAFPMSDFSAFGVLDDGVLLSIRLIPTKRLAPAIVIYFAEEDGEEIVNVLGRHMPMEQMEYDFLDLVMRKLRF